MRQETWSHKSGKQLKQRSHLGLRCIELSELRRDLQIFLPSWLMTGDWGAVPQALTSVIKAAASAKCNWADCLGSSKHYVIGLIKVIREPEEETVDGIRAFLQSKCFSLKCRNEQLKAVSAEINPRVAGQFRWRLKRTLRFDMHSDSDNVKIMCSLKGDEDEVRGD